MSTNVGIEQWAKVEKPATPTNTNYAARGAVGPGPAFNGSPGDGKGAPVDTRKQWLIDNSGPMVA